jgi:hypothetical protein
MFYFIGTTGVAEGLHLERKTDTETGKWDGFNRPSDLAASREKIDGAPLSIGIQRSITACRYANITASDTVVLPRSTSGFSPRFQWVLRVMLIHIEGMKRRGQMFSSDLE